MFGRFSVAVLGATLVLGGAAGAYAIAGDHGGTRVDKHAVPLRHESPAVRAPAVDIGAREARVVIDGKLGQLVKSGDVVAHLGKKPDGSCMSAPRVGVHVVQHPGEPNVDVTLVPDANCDLHVDMQSGS